MAKKMVVTKRERWTLAQVWEQIVAIIVDRFGDDKLTKDTITRNTSFGPDGINPDSLDTVELVMELDDAFDISIPDEIVPNLKTAGDTEILIDQKLQEQGRLI